MRFARFRRYFDRRTDSLTSVHTGSRGLGASILADKTKSEPNPYIAPDSPELGVYLEEHDYAVKWAIANRDLVAHRVKQCLILPSDSTEAAAESASPSNLCKIVDVTHNSVTKLPLTVGSDAEPRDLWIHRKGAAPTGNGIAPCPGSRGHFSWLLKPLGNGEYNGQCL